MKRKRLSFFWKTFTLTIIMLLIITMIAYTLLYLLLPHYYKSYKINQYDGLVGQLTKQLEDTGTFTGEKELLAGFAQENSVSITVLGENNEVLYDFSQSSIVTISENSSFEDEGNSVEVTKETDIGEAINLKYSYNLNGEARILQVIVTLQPLNEAKAVIINIYPIAVLLCVIFSFILASIFSGYFVKPIRKIRQITVKMTQLEPDAKIPVVTADEIGELSHDINNLYQELRGTIDVLEKEISRYSDSENKKIDFLRTVSHELKTPLASANALIEGIIYDVPPYDKNQREYLRECKAFLDKAIQLTKESLNLSQGYKEEAVECNLKKLVSDISSEYRVILMSKQMKYSEKIPEHIYLKIKVNMFSKALSNVFSNAANYTPEHGKINVEYLEKQSLLIIENTCVPLSENEQKKLFAPFYPGNGDNHLSTGLGLYIINQLLRLLQIEYSFTPMEKGKGMKFTICLKDLLLT